MIHVPDKLPVAVPVEFVPDNMSDSTIVPESDPVNIVGAASPVDPVPAADLVDKPPVKDKPLVPVPAKVPAADPENPCDKTSTCLLYTSPSPRDGLLSRMPSSA